MAGKIENQVQNASGAQVTKAPTMQDYVRKMEGEIKKALPSVMTPERFTRMVLSALSTTKELQSCTPESFLGAMMAAAQLGVEPNTPLGMSYILPYKNHGRLEAQFQLGYKGIIDLAYRSGEIEVIQAHMVYENDKFICAYGLDPRLEHIPADGDRGKPIKVYALFKTKSGGFGFEVLSIEDVRVHAAKYSKSYTSSYSPWQTNFEEMAKKTALKKVLKYAPLKSDFVKAVVQDETIKNSISDDMYEVRDDTIYDVPYSSPDSEDSNSEEIPEE